MSIKKICSLLKNEYGCPRLGNKFNPLDEYIYILLSLKTTYWSFEKVYKVFKRAYPTYEKANRARVKSIAKVIKEAGLSNQRAKYIKKTLKIIKQDFGEFSLRKLKKYDDAKLEKYLMTLPGLGLKAARCIMLYSFSRDTLPVDTHTQRISERLGLINKTSSAQSHELLDKIIPADSRYVYHAGCVVHGRKICLHNKQDCKNCILSKYCKYYKHRCHRNGRSN